MLHHTSSDNSNVCVDASYLQDCHVSCTTKPMNHNSGKLVYILSTIDNLNIS